MTILKDSCQQANHILSTPSNRIPSPTRGLDPASANQTTYSVVSPNQSLGTPRFADSTAQDPKFSAWLATVENASLSRLHTSTTESVLAWPHFECYPDLRHADLNIAISIFDMEQARPPPQSLPCPTEFPLVTDDEMADIASAFVSSVNLWYPVLSKTRLDDVVARISQGLLTDDCNCCLASLVMALGCASHNITSAIDRQHERQGTKLPQYHNNTLDTSVQNSSRAERLRDVYFACALSRIHVAYREMTPSALLCLLFTA
jgi:hypothetical protein